MTISHYGRVEFVGGQYHRSSGSDNWTVEPIPGFGIPNPPPVGQVWIRFKEEQPENYVVLVTAERIEGQPLVAANYGDTKSGGFVVHLWETIADRTVVNANFSFSVLQG